MSAGANQLSKPPATIEDLLGMPEEDRYELVDGELAPKEAARGEHGHAQTNVITSLNGPFGRRPPGGPPDRPGGWWFESEILIQFTPANARRPDVAGWRRERVPNRPTGTPIAVLPDWICEILSPTNASNDTVTKMRLYHQVQIPHYWLVDPRDETLTVYRWTAEGYTLIVSAARKDRVRAEPFSAIELSVGVFFGDDEE